jgi:hypothetical protein
MLNGPGQNRQVAGKSLQCSRLRRIVGGVSSMALRLPLDKTFELFAGRPARELKESNSEEAAEE